MLSNRLAVLPKIMQVMVSGGVEVCDCQVAALPLEEIFVHALNSEGIKEDG
jgi:hypothetical protein